MKNDLIIQAAIKFRDKTFVGWRHSEIRDKIREETNAPREEIMLTCHDPWKVGFITTSGKFLTRKQALSLARINGQVDEIIGSELTSEDLWDVEGKPIKN